MREHEQRQERADEPDLRRPEEEVKDLGPEEVKDLEPTDQDGKDVNGGFYSWIKD